MALPLRFSELAASAWLLERRRKLVVASGQGVGILSNGKRGFGMSGKGGGRQTQLLQARRGLWVVLGGVGSGLFILRVYMFGEIALMA